MELFPRVVVNSVQVLLVTTSYHKYPLYSQMALESHIPSFTKKKNITIGSGTERPRGRHKGRNFSSVRSLACWPQQPGLCQAEVSSLDHNLGPSYGGQGPTS